MRRFLLLLMMLVLSVQTTWAAASSVCRHEAAAQAAHFGHHAHAHQDAAGMAQGEPDDAAGVAEGNPDDAGRDVIDADCGQCQLGANALAAGAAEIERTAPPPSGATPYRRSVTHGLPERLTRPPHPFLA